MMYDCRWCSAVCFQISSNTKFRTMQFSGSFHVENLVQVCLSMLFVSSVKMLATAPVSPCRLTRILLSSYLFPLCQSLFTYVSDFRLAGKLRMHWGIWTRSKVSRTVNTRSRDVTTYARAARKMASRSLDICPSCPLTASVNSHYSTQKMNPWTAIRSECTVIWQWDQIYILASAVVHVIYWMKKKVSTQHWIFHFWLQLLSSALYLFVSSSPGAS